LPITVRNIVLFGSPDKGILKRSLSFPLYLSFTSKQYTVSPEETARVSSPHTPKVMKGERQRETRKRGIVV
jgi:hypothetical protein